MAATLASDHGHAVSAVPGRFTYEGRVFDLNGSPSVESVSFKVRIFNPTGSCLLFEESHSAVDLSQTSGTFALDVGAGSPTAGNPGLSLVQVFSNNGVKVGAGACTYTPADGHDRKLEVVVIDSGSTETMMSPRVSIASVPFALVAGSLEGKRASSFIATSVATTQTNVDSVFSATNYPKLTALLGGTSAEYVRMSASTGAAMPTYSGNPMTPAAGQVWLDSATGQLKFHDGMSVQALTSGTLVGGITNINGLTSGTQYFSTGMAGASPGFNSAGTAHTLNIPMASGAGVTAGLISKTEFDAFNSKLSPALSNAQIYVGNASNVATAVSPSGDVTMSNSGVVTLASSGVTAGSYPKVHVDSKGRVVAGLALLSTDIPGLAASHITAGTLSIARGGTGVGFTPANGQLLIGNGTDYTLTTLTAGTGVSINNTPGAITINATGGSGSVTNVTAGTGLSGGAITTTGTIALATTGIAAGTFSKVIIDQFGRAVSGSTLLLTDIPDLDATKITSGTLASARLPSSVILDGGNTTGAGVVIGTNDLQKLQFKTNGATQLTVDTSGYFGIGTTSPAYTLDVNGIINASSNVQTFTAGASVYPQMNIQAISTNGSAQWVTMRARGTSVGSPLAVNDGDTVGNFMGRVHNGTDYQDAAWMTFAVDGTNVTGSGNRPGGRIDFVTRRTTDTGQYSLTNNVMTIRNSGNVGIGTTNPQRNLHVEGANADAKIAVMNTSSTAARYPAMEVINYSGGFAGVPRFSGTTYRGNSGTPAAVQSGDALASLEGAGGRDAAWNTNNTAQILMTATQTYSASNGGSAISFKTTPNNSGTMADRMIIGQDGNVGIGTTTPSSRLQVIGAVQPGDDAAACVAVKNGAIRFNGGNLQVCLSMTWTTLSTGGGGGTPAGATTQVQFNSSGTFGANFNFVWDNTNGRLGIGIPSPGQSLSVNGRIETRGGMLLNQGSAATDNLIYLGSSVSGPVNASMGMFAAGIGSAGANDGPYTMARGNTFSAVANQRGSMYLAAGNPSSPMATEGSINFLTGSDVNRMIIDRNGNVGIGTQYPGSQLHIEGTDVGNRVRIRNGSSTTSRYPGLEIVNYADATSGAPTTVLSNLRGNASSSAALVAGDSLGSHEFWGGTNTAHNLAQGAEIRAIAEAGFSVTSAPSGLVFSTTQSGQVWPSERMRITASGNIGIGTTSASAKLTVQGNILANGRIDSGVQVNSDSLSSVTADFSGTNIVRAMGASAACGNLNVVNIGIGGSYTVSIPNATATCTAIQLNGSPANVKLDPYYAAGATANGVVYTFLYDGLYLWMSSVGY